MRSLKLSGLLAVALVLVPLAARANHYSDFYVIPVASHTAGINGTVWMSDVSIQNFQSSPLTVSLVFLQAGENNLDNISALVTGAIPGSVTVPAGGTTILKDVLNDFAGMSSVSGALLIGADKPFAVTSRSYNQSPTGDTYGQTVVPTRDFIDNSIGRTDLNMAVAYLPGLINNDRFRTNLGFFAGNASSTGETMVVEFTLKDATGAAIGTPRRFAIPASTFKQLQFSSRAIADQRFDAASATVRITQGNGAVSPYASIVDNRTTDAVFISGQFPPNSQSSPASAAAFGVFRTLFEQIRIIVTE